MWKKCWKSCSKHKAQIIRLLNCLTICCLIIEADKFRVIKAATVAIGLPNKNTRDVISSFGAAFFIGGEYIVRSAHVFSQCLKYNM